MTDAKRPYAKIRKWDWMDGDHKTPGVGIFHGGKLMAHLKPDEARIWADHLHDISDRIESETQA